MHYDASTLRKTSDTKDFPYTSRLVTFIHISANGTVTADHTLTGKRSMLTRAGQGDLLLAAWPGQHRQDVFMIDDQAAARKALGIKTTPEQDATQRASMIQHLARQGQTPEAIARVFGMPVEDVLAAPDYVGGSANESCESERMPDKR